jgi:hypothetical protein
MNEQYHSITSESTTTDESANGIDLSRIVAADLVNPPLPHTGRRPSADQQAANEGTIAAAVATVQSLIDEIAHLRADAVLLRRNAEYLGTRNRTLTNRTAELANRLATSDGLIGTMPQFLGAAWRLGTVSGSTDDLERINVNPEGHQATYHFGVHTVTHRVPSRYEQQRLTIDIDGTSAEYAYPGDVIGFGPFVDAVRRLPWRRPRPSILGGIGFGPKSPLDKLCGGDYPVCPNCHMKHPPIEFLESLVDLLEDPSRNR